jgi:hypothetical protein
MGRKKIRTENEKQELNRQWRMRYYWEHADEERRKNLKRYYKTKRLKISPSG